MSDTMQELSPKSVELTRNAVGASADLAVSNRFKNLISEKAGSVTTMVADKMRLARLTLAALVVAGCSNVAEQPIAQTPVEPTPISTPTIAPTETIVAPTVESIKTPEELLAKHNARLIELSKIFKEEGKYPQEEVEQWLKAAGITWDMLTVHGLPFPEMILKETIGDRRIPSGVVGFGSNIKVSYPAHIEFASNFNYSKFSRLEKATEAKLDGGKRTAWTNVEVNDPTGAVALKVDGSHITELSPK